MCQNKVCKQPDDDGDSGTVGVDHSAVECAARADRRVGAPSVTQTGDRCDLLVFQLTAANLSQ